MSGLKQFETTTELIKYLGIPRPTFYRRAQKLGISTTKGQYTQQELEQLKRPLSNAGSKNSTEQLRSSDTVSVLMQQLETANETIRNQAEQIKEANKIADQAQRLQSDLQQQLRNVSLLIETKQDIDNSDRIDQLIKENEELKQKLAIEKTRGFWNRFFNK